VAQQQQQQQQRRSGGSAAIAAAGCGGYLDIKYCLSKVTVVVVTP
jgi:hypothetical protein